MDKQKTKILLSRPSDNQLQIIHTLKCSSHNNSENHALLATDIGVGDTSTYNTTQLPATFALFSNQGDKFLIIQNLQCMVWIEISDDTWKPSSALIGFEDTYLLFLASNSDDNDDSESDDSDACDSLLNSMFWSNDGLLILVISKVKVSRSVTAGNVTAWSSVSGNKIFNFSLGGLELWKYDRCSNKIAVVSDIISNYKIKIFSYDESSQPANNVSAANQSTLITKKKHTGSITYLMCNPSGMILASCSSDGVVKLWRCSTTDVLFTFPANNSPVKALQWLSDKCIAFSILCDIQLWTENYPSVDILLWSYLRALTLHDSAVIAMAWSPFCASGYFLASSSQNGTIIISQTSQVSLYANISTIDFTTVHMHKIAKGVASLAWNPDGTILAAGSYDQSIRLFQRKESGFNLIHTIIDETDVPSYMDLSRSVAWHPSGLAFATSTKSNFFQIYEIHPMQSNQTNSFGASVLLSVNIFDRSRRNMMCNDYIFSVAWSQRSGDLVLMTSVRYLRLWRVSTTLNPSSKRRNMYFDAELFMVLEQSCGSVYFGCWNDVSNTFTVGYEDGSIIAWDSVSAKK